MVALGLALVIVLGLFLAGAWLSWEGASSLHGQANRPRGARHSAAPAGGMTAFAIGMAIMVLVVVLVVFLSVYFADVLWK